VKSINGAPASTQNQLRYEGNLEAIQGRTGPDANTGSISPFRLLALIGDKETIVRRWSTTKITDAQGDKVTIYFPTPTQGNQILRPGLKYKLEGSTPLQKLDFISLMLALFCGTAALPHILIRYYTVPSPACARKSTIVAIAAIGFFYILTLFMGLGAMVNGVVNLTDNNMSAPLLAKSFGTLLFAIISAIAFATVLGTVSGLIVAASGAVAHDLMDRFAGMVMNERQKVRAGKMAAFAIGLLAIVLGILFKGMNVNFLVGLAFAVAASANLPAIIMLLFWKKTTAQGITASIVIGVLTALILILLSPSMFQQYGWDPLAAPIPFDNPGFISIPLSFITLVLVSLLTKKRIAM
jgi:cation/acetate symporter